MRCYETESGRTSLVSENNANLQRLILWPFSRVHSMEWTRLIRSFRHHLISGAKKVQRAQDVCSDKFNKCLPLSVTNIEFGTWLLSVGGSMMSNCCFQQSHPWAFMLFKESGQFHQVSAPLNQHNWLQSKKVNVIINSLLFIWGATLRDSDFSWA